MRKPKKIKIGTSYEEILHRFNDGSMLPTDYRFIAGQMRLLKDDIRYHIVKAKIESIVAGIRKTPKRSEDSGYILGRIEGMQNVLDIIDDLAVYDREKEKEELAEQFEPTTVDQPIANEEAPII